MEMIKQHETTAIFGLTYLEEEEVELTDVVGCLAPGGTGYTTTGCDDTDSGSPFPIIEP